MLWQIFNTEAEAIAYTEAEAIAHLPLGPNVTRRLADPMALTDGRWVVQCFDSDGMEWQPDWALSEKDLTNFTLFT